LFFDAQVERLMMRVQAVQLAVIVAALAAPLAASAQTVQLPTYSFTTVSTTVMVPDRGAAFLGGINRAASGRSEYGVPGLPLPGFQNRAIGQERGASNMWVTATIHDFEAMDQALLSTPTVTGFGGLPGDMPRGLTAPRPQFAAPAPREPVNLAGNWRREAAPAAPVHDAAAEEAARAGRQVARSQEAENYFARGQQAEADGKPNVAKIYYQMAARRATGDLKQLVQSRLDVVSGRTTAVANAR
jgi:hypothetical protein